MFGKQNISSFPKGVNKVERHLEIIYLDMRGPMDDDSLNRSHNYVSFIDDISKYTWIILCIQNIKFH